VIASYDKLHMFDVDLPNGDSWRESSLFAAGSCAVVADTELFRLGLSICYDIRFPELYAALAKAGAEVLTAPSCFTRQTGEAHWHVLTRARAIETGSFLVAATQGGTHEDGRQSFGHAIIVDPWGRVLAEGGEDPSVILADLDLGEVAAARRRIPALAHRRPFTVEHVAASAGLRRAS
jgi:predicted amidohydrolase